MTARRRHRPLHGPKRLHWWRLSRGLLAILAWSCLVVWAARSAEPIPAGIAGAAFALPLISLGEWLVHGLLYHRGLPGMGVIRRIHQQGHHVALFPPHRYRKRDGYEFMRVRAPLEPFVMAENGWDNALTKWSQIALHLGVGVPLVLGPAWAATGSATFALGALAALGVTSFLLAHVHGAIHTPRGRFIERQSWFRWLDRHHYIHHVDPSANINFLLPLCDVLFGTYRQRLAVRAQAAATRA